MLPFIGLSALGYLLGSIPFGLVVASRAGIDIRNTGSGNPGATNMFRQGGPKLGATVLVLDALKAYIPTAIAIAILPEAWQHICVGLTGVIGHSYPIFAKFKGGKGAAPGLGILLALSPKIFGILALVAISIISLWRYVSVGTITCSLLAPILFFTFDYPLVYSGFVSTICTLIIFRHIPNIKRLIKGVENKI